MLYGVVLNCYLEKLVLIAYLHADLSLQAGDIVYVFHDLNCQRFDFAYDEKQTAILAAHFKMNQRLDKIPIYVYNDGLYQMRISSDILIYPISFHYIVCMLSLLYKKD